MRESRNLSYKWHRAAWIRSLERRPEIVELFSVEGDGASQERAWIEFFKALGCDLTNTAVGGAGGWSDEARRKALEATRGRRRTPEEIEAIRAGNSGQKRTEQTRERISKARANQTILHSAETKAKISASLKGHTVSEETRKRQSEAAKNRKKRT